MYLWNTKALAKELRDGTLTERERMKYYLLFVAVDAVGAELVTYSSEIVSLASVAKSVLIIIGIVAGTYIAYRANCAGDDKDFIGRSICLSVPINIRLLVAVAGLYLACAVVDSIIGGKAFDSGSVLTRWFEVVVYCIAMVVFYWRLWHHIAWVSSSLVSPKPEPVVEPRKAVPPLVRNRGIFIILGLVFGLFGFHNFYAGHYKRGAFKIGCLLFAAVTKDLDLILLQMIPLIMLVGAIIEACVTTTAADGTPMA